MKCYVSIHVVNSIYLVVAETRGEVRCLLPTTGKVLLLYVVSNTSATCGVRFAHLCIRSRLLVCQ